MTTRRQARPPVSEVLKKESSSTDLDANRLQQYKAAFNLFSDGQDKLDANQLRNFLVKFGIRDAKAEDMIKEGDTKGSGFIDVTDFITLMSKKMVKADAEEDLKDAFQKFDWRKTYLIPSAELHEALTNLGKPLSIKEWSTFQDICERDNGQIHYSLFIEALVGENQKK
jgi:calmodulin